MTYEDVLERAKQVLSPKCRVCRECNGIACKGEIPGVGAVGSGASFTDCRTYLKSIKLHMDAVHEHFEPDTTFQVFGKVLRAPIMVAPIGGMSFNYTDYLTETQYTQAIVNGALSAGILAFTGDGPKDDYFPSTLPVIEQAGGMAIPTIKPWEREKVLGRLREIAPYRCVAVAMDVDSAALVNLKLQGKPAFTKSAPELAEFVREAKSPFIVKGVLTVPAAQRCVVAGAKAIVLSNHGGRIMEDAMPPVSVIRTIRDHVGSRIKIFVDGGIRSGADIFKCLALGADAVLIGRPYAIAAHGGGEEGVRLLSEKLIGELKETMLMTDCKTLADINREKIFQI